MSERRIGGEKFTASVAQEPIGIPARADVPTEELHQRLANPGNHSLEQLYEISRSLGAQRRVGNALKPSEGPTPHEWDLGIDQRPIPVQIKMKLYAEFGRIKGLGQTFPPLPSEADIAEQTHTSRVSVRTAMAELVQDGILTLKRGVGYSVNEEFIPALNAETREPKQPDSSLETPVRDITYPRSGQPEAHTAATTAEPTEEDKRVARMAAEATRARELLDRSIIPARQRTALAVILDNHAQGRGIDSQVRREIMNALNLSQPPRRTLEALQQTLRKTRRGVVKIEGAMGNKEDPLRLVVAPPKQERDTQEQSGQGGLHLGASEPPHFQDTGREHGAAAITGQEEMHLDAPEVVFRRQRRR